MTDLVTFIRFDGDRLTGNIAAMAYDIDLIGEDLMGVIPWD